MFSLIIGGAACGKSEYAERHVLSLPGRRIYLAAMEPWDDECRARIARHRAARAGRGFETVERYRDLAGLRVPPDGNILLEDLSNLLANELYGHQGQGLDAVCAGLSSLRTRCAHLTVVTNEIFSGGADYAGDTLAFMRALGELNRNLAEQADFVCEVVCGLPNVLKGAEL